MLAPLIAESKEASCPELFLAISHTQGSFMPYARFDRMFPEITIYGVHTDGWFMDRFYL